MAFLAVLFSLAPWLSLEIMTAQLDSSLCSRCRCNFMHPLVACWDGASCSFLHDCKLQPYPFPPLPAGRGRDARLRAAPRPPG